MDKHYYTAKSYEDAVTEAITDLREQKENLIIKEKSTKNGLFSKKIEIEVIEKREVENYIKKLISEITSSMGIKVEIEVKHQEYVLFQLYSDNNGILIGKNGRTLDALMTILKQAVFVEIGEYYPFHIDANDYKKNVDKELEFLAKREARNVVRTKVEVKLTAMNSYQRRIVHNVLTNYKGVYTESVGEEPNRAVVIKPQED